VQRNNTKDKHQTQHQHNDGVDLEAGALVRVQPQHGAGAAARARGPRAGRPHIGNLLLLVGRRAASDGCAGAAGGCWRRGAVDAAAGCGRAEDWGGRAGG